MNLLGKWKDKATQYIDVRVQLMKLKFIERASNVLGSLMLAFVLMMVSIAVLMFMGLGILECFSALFDSRIAGAFATAGVFILLMLIILGFRKGITTACANIFIRIMTEPGEDDDDDSEDRDSDKERKPATED